MLHVAAALGIALAASPAAAQCVAPACTKIVDNGPDAGKQVLVVLGDGYAAADQATYDADVDKLLRSGVFGNDFFLEHQNAFNVYRLNLVSHDSGVTQKVYDEHGTWNDGSDDTVVSVTSRDTALHYVWSGSWAHCWLESSPDTWALEQAALTQYVPNRDFVVVILNQNSYGGCGGGNHQTVPRGVGWQVLAHEFGHGVGGLMDEYVAFDTTWAGGSVTGPNCSTTLPPAWHHHVVPGTPVPTSSTPAPAHPDRDVGAYEGCRYHAKGIYRPVENCRMRGNTNPFCPVCWEHMRTRLQPYLSHPLQPAVAGRFTGGAGSDIVLRHPDDVGLYRYERQESAVAPQPARLDFLWMANDKIPGAAEWPPQAGDISVAADLDGDGRDDLVVLNRAKGRLGLLRATGAGFEVLARYDNHLPGCWHVASIDEILPGDFDGDGKVDLYLFSRSAASLAMFRSTGTAIALTAQYGPADLPGWPLRSSDVFSVADFDGDKKHDLYTRSSSPLLGPPQPWGPSGWSVPYLGMLRSSGTGLATVKRYALTAAGWQLGFRDLLLAGDFDRDGRDDLYLVSRPAAPTGPTHIGMLRTTGAALQLVRVYGPRATPLPGWALKPTNQLAVMDADGDGRADLVGLDVSVLHSERLAVLRSTGTSLSSLGVTDAVGAWDLRAGDRLLTAATPTASRNLFLDRDDGVAVIRWNAGWKMEHVYAPWIARAVYDGSSTMPMPVPTPAPAQAAGPTPAPERLVVERSVAGKGVTP